MFKSIKVKLYPTVKQKEMLDRHFDGYRFAYNLSLEYRQMMWNLYSIYKSGIDLQNELFDVRKSSKWLSLCKAECIRDAGLNVDKAVKKFFKGNGYPKFKKKSGEQSFAAYQSIKSIGNKIVFFRNRIKYRTSAKYSELLDNNNIKRITFKRDCVGDYFASCLIEVKDLKKAPIIDKIIGVDLGLKSLVVTSDGVIFDNNKYLAYTIERIKKLQRKFSKSKKGSNNGKKLSKRIAKLYRKSTRQKEYYYHSITNKLLSDSQTIAVETLRIKNLVKNHNMALAIKDASWGLLVKQLEYKSLWHGKSIIKIDTFFPSTKMCSACGNVQSVSLKERVYNCECGLSLDRDINAAINIRNAGIKIPGVLMEGVGYEPDEVRSKSLIFNN